MRRVILSLLLVLASLPAIAESVSLYEGALSLQPPAGFRPMTREQIATKFPTARPPQHAFADGDRLTATIALSRVRAPSGQALALETFGASMQQALAAQPNVRVHRHSVITVNGRQWYAIDFASDAVDQPVENMMRIAIADGHVIFVSANVVKHLFSEQEAALRTALDSATLR